MPPGGFFVCADTSSVSVPASAFEEESLAAPSPMPRDWALARHLTQDVKVAAIPPSAFYEPANKGAAAEYLRFAFCKTDEELEEAKKRLLEAKEKGKL